MRGGARPKAVAVAVNQEALEGNVPSYQVEREKVCPLLLRVFPKRGGHHKPIEFSRRGEEPKGEVQMYTWMDATLREVASLLQDVHPLARHPGAIMEFVVIFPDKRGNFTMRPLGRVHSRLKGPDDDLSLHVLKFQIGDYIDVAIMTPDAGPGGVRGRGMPGMGPPGVLMGPGPGQPGPPAMRGPPGPPFGRRF